MIPQTTRAQSPNGLREMTLACWYMSYVHPDPPVIGMGVPMCLGLPDCVGVPRRSLPVRITLSLSLSSLVHAVLSTTLIAQVQPGPVECRCRCVRGNAKLRRTALFL